MRILIYYTVIIRDIEYIRLISGIRVLSMRVGVKRGRF